MPSKRKSVAVMIEGALCIALSIVLSYFDLFKMPQGGSVDFSLMPLILFTYRRGLKWGVQAGIVSGVIRILLGSYVYNPVQAILDYPLSYAFVGLCAAHPRIIGLILSAIGKISCHVISGAIFFAKYAPEGQNPWIYSILYNTPVEGIKYILSGIVALILWKALERELPVSE
ncbi:MAG: energy-coupled thiamine transporter ThiT [Synergistaceae bacterium]|nr:energy-coupled thiamine transporter ThiT [Synergistaceae bacterium]MBR0249554.1 energy-coupled thiamine transporter ThiT [Synergistaceae bacterium]